MISRFKRLFVPLDSGVCRNHRLRHPYNNSPGFLPLTAMIDLVVFLVLCQSSTDHDRALDTFFLHLAADIVGIRNAAVEVEGICRASAAAVESRKAVFAFFFRVYIAKLEFIAHLRVDHAGIHVSEQELFISNELVARI